MLTVIIIVCADQLLYVINDILDLSKLDENKMPLEKSPFSIRHVIEESSEIIAFDAQKKSLEIIIDIDPSMQGNQF